METENKYNLEEQKDSPFYTKAKTYWSSIPPTVDGMLGGFGFISDCDIVDSERFLNHILELKRPPGKDRALDCGAGIGRVTKYLLVKFFNVVDLVEQERGFISQARDFISSEQIGELYCSGLQDFKPLNKYDVIWCQWVLGHLSDVHFVEFMKNCKGCLKKDGVIVVKENVASSKNGEIDLDEVDSSVTRADSLLKRLFTRSGLKWVKESNQTGFPQGLYRVKMFALRPAADLTPTTQVI